MGCGLNGLWLDLDSDSFFATADYDDDTLSRRQFHRRYFHDFAAMFPGYARFSLRCFSRLYPYYTIHGMHSNRFYAFRRHE